MRPSCGNVILLISLSNGMFSTILQHQKLECMIVYCFMPCVCCSGSPLLSTLLAKIGGCTLAVA